MPNTARTPRAASTRGRPILTGRRAPAIGRQDLRPTGTPVRWPDLSPTRALNWGTLSLGSFEPIRRAYSGYRLPRIHFDPSDFQGCQADRRKATARPGIGFVRAGGFWFLVFLTSVVDGFYIRNPILASIVQETGRPRSRWSSPRGVPTGRGRLRPTCSRALQGGDAYDGHWLCSRVFRYSRNVSLPWRDRSGSVSSESELPSRARTEGAAILEDTTWTLVRTWSRSE